MSSKYFTNSQRSKNRGRENEDGGRNSKRGGREVKSKVFLVFCSVSPFDIFQH